MILVVGATGRVGGAITRQLLEQGKDVRILIRHNSPSEHLAQQGMATPASTLIAAGAQPVYGDLKDEASLHRSVAGVHTIVATAISVLRGGDDNVETVERQGYRWLVDAAAQAGVDHFVFISTLGATLDSPNDFMRAKAETEQRLRQSGMDYTILVPTAFIDVWPAMVVGMPALQGQPVTLVGEGRRHHAFIYGGDVAAFAVAAVDNPAARNQVLAIGGPQALSWREVVATYERVLGREIPVNWVQPGEPVPGLPPAMGPMLASFETYDSPVPMDETAAAYGIQLTSLEQMIREQVAARAGS
ncbi:MAG: SDR family oxidoreductase [Anaerolineae bacterium]|nr:SDR family oxidoreductase [Anaerolineae bacterium]